MPATFLVEEAYGTLAKSCQGAAASPVLVPLLARCVLPAHSSAPPRASLHFLRAVLGACLQLGDEAAMRELAINQFSGLFAEDSQASYGSDGMD